LHEVGDGGAQFCAVAEDAPVDGLFLQCAEEAFHHTVGLGLATEGEAGGEAVVANLLQEVVGGVLPAVIQPQGQAAILALEVVRAWYRRAGHGLGGVGRGSAEVGPILMVEEAAKKGILSAKSGVVQTRVTLLWLTIRAGNRTSLVTSSGCMIGRLHRAVATPGLLEPRPRSASELKVPRANAAGEAQKRILRRNELDIRGRLAILAGPCGYSSLGQRDLAGHGYSLSRLGGLGFAPWWGTTGECHPLV